MVSPEPNEDQATDGEDQRLREVIATIDPDILSKAMEQGARAAFGQVLAFLQETPAEPASWDELATAIESALQNERCKGKDLGHGSIVTAMECMFGWDEPGKPLEEACLQAEAKDRPTNLRDAVREAWLLRESAIRKLTCPDTSDRLKPEHHVRSERRRG